jgi:prefoldin subunit 4
MATVGSMRPLGGVALKKTDTEIERLDQEKICAFSRANMKYTDLKNDIKKLKEEIDNLEDATLLVEESMGEGLKLFLGECFVTVDEEQGNLYVQKVAEEKQEELDAKTDQMDKLEAEMKNLKSYLYARFGSSINLEENDS